MLTAGIIGQDSKMQAADLINSILSSAGKKISVIDMGNFCSQLEDTGANDLCKVMQSDSRKLKSYVNELRKNNTDILLLKVNISDVQKEVFDSLSFDVIICNDIADDFMGNNVDKGELMKRVFSLLKEKGLIIVNADNNEIIDILKDIRHYTVTYGFNTKASITTSSIGDTILEDSFMCCLQRSIPARNGTIIEPQEYRVKVEPGELDTYNVLAAAAFAIVNGVDLNKIQ